MNAFDQVQIDTLGNISTINEFSIMHKSKIQDDSVLNLNKSISTNQLKTFSNLNDLEKSHDLHMNLETFKRTNSKNSFDKIKSFKNFNRRRSLKNKKLISLLNEETKGKDKLIRR